MDGTPTGTERVGLSRESGPDNSALPDPGPPLAAAVALLVQALITAGPGSSSSPS